MCIRDRYQRRVRGHQSSNMADTLVELLKRVQSAADACGKGDEVTLNPGADEETMAELKEIEVAVPEQVRALLAYTNGARVFDMWVPSTEEMVEHWGYNEAYPPVYTRHKALPWGMIDYDFCWRVLDREGRVWLVGGECEQGCLLYTSDAADEEDSVDLGGRRIFKQKNQYIRSLCNIRSLIIYHNIHTSHSRPFL
eukprot:TRINITY_DN2615_c0_g1_i5.p1 TRINITY_DN2615_c0_g1~~TRINITY_DN2615_c0_g1_i5.p1  ORF type:complete len:196 (-),score=33.16 TRINITY_DN2615_c0_g1_i5:4-591(-)